MEDDLNTKHSQQVQALMERMQAEHPFLFRIDTWKQPQLQVPPTDATLTACVCSCVCAHGCVCLCAQSLQAAQRANKEVELYRASIDAAKQQGLSQAAYLLQTDLNFATQRRSQVWWRPALPLFVG